jgi:histidine decarboxylase
MLNARQGHWVPYLLKFPGANEKEMTLSLTDQARLSRHLENLGKYAKTELGYPCALDIDYKPLEAFLRYSQNNIGDPFATGSFRMNSHEFEREVLEFFAQLTHAPENEWWGYVTNGGTESNLS